MSVLHLLDLGLAALVVGLAFWTISARALFTSVTAYVVYGLMLALVWVRLYAPDVALTEAAVGGGVTGVLLITAGKRLDALKSARPLAAPGPMAKILVGLLCAAVAGALALAIFALPLPAPSLAPAAVAAQYGPGAGLGNPITAVLISYRAFDTMLEKVVLILAVVGVWSVGGDEFWGLAPAPMRHPPPDGPMRFLAQSLCPVGVVIGVHIFWVGADAPGGAFQGGALLAAMWMAAMMAKIIEPPMISASWLRLTLIAGPAVFLVIGLAGLGLADAFFAYPKNFAKPVILFIEAFMVASIAVALPLLVAGPPARSENS